MNQVDTVENALQLFEERVYPLKQVVAALGVGHDGVNHLMVTLNDSVELIAIALVALTGHLRDGYQLVGDTVKRAYYNYDRPPSGFCLYNLF